MVGNILPPALRSAIAVPPGEPSGWVLKGQNEPSTPLVGSPPNAKEPRGDLNCLRATPGLLTFLLNHGGIAVFDPWMFQWWGPEEWKERVFEPGGAVPRHHVIILTSEEPADPPLTWFHTRGLRKFGRPDLSVHRVPQQYREAVIELCNRFIEFQAFGGVIGEGQQLRMRTLPKGMTCHLAGDLDDPEFNNVHGEITPPA